MIIILALIFVSLLLAIGFLIAFFWAVNTGQYEDHQTPAMRILFEDEPENTNTKDHLEDSL